VLAGLLLPVHDGELAAQAQPFAVRPLAAGPRGTTRGKRKLPKRWLARGRLALALLRLWCSQLVRAGSRILNRHGKGCFQGRKRTYLQVAVNMYAARLFRAFPSSRLIGTSFLVAVNCPGGLFLQAEGIWVAWW